MLTHTTVAAHFTHNKTVVAQPAVPVQQSNTFHPQQNSSGTARCARPTKQYISPSTKQ